MTYGYSGPWSGPARSRRPWLDHVLTFAQSKVPARKIYMGVPFFGYSWHGGSVATVSGHRGASLARTTTPP